MNILEELATSGTPISVVVAGEDNSLGHLTIGYRRLRGSMDEVISRLAAQSALIIPAAGSSPLATSGVWVKKTPGISRTFAWASVREISLNVGWRVVAGGRMAPDFHRNEGVVMVKTWRPPEGVIVIVVSMMDWESSARNYRFGDGCCNYLMCYAQGLAPGWLRPPLANLYDDGRLCMPAPAGRHQSISDAWGAVVNAIGGTRFCADLSARFTIAQSDAVFSFNPDGTQVPITAPDFVALCGRCNTTVYDGITLPL